MQCRHLVGLVTLLAVVPSSATSQERPDFTGTWVLSDDAPHAADGKPAAAPGLGPRVVIWHQGKEFTVTRVFPGGTVAVTHVLDGSSTSTRAPGRVCEGDSQSWWTAVWQDETSVLTTLVGIVPPGGTAATKTDTRTVFRFQSPTTMIVQTASRSAAAGEPKVVSTTYNKSGPAGLRPPAPATPSTRARLTQLEWLSGTWIGSGGTNTFEERWTPPEGGAMLAVARTLRNGVMTAFEFLCIVERNGGLVYTAMPNARQPPTDFTLTRIDPHSVTFENPAHDFPKMIRYALSGDGTLEAVVSGTDKQKPQIFRFHRKADF